jgi:hypothetical protein
VQGSPEPHMVQGAIENPILTHQPFLVIVKTS